MSNLRNKCMITSRQCNNTIILPSTIIMSWLNQSYSSLKYKINDKILVAKGSNGWMICKSYRIYDSILQVCNSKKRRNSTFFIIEVYHLNSDTDLKNQILHIVKLN